MFNLAAVNEAIAAAFPDQEAIVFRDRRITFGQLNERTRRLANYLSARGLGVHKPRSELRTAGSRARISSRCICSTATNISKACSAATRRVLRRSTSTTATSKKNSIYLLNNARARAIIYHANFAPRVAAVRDKVPSLEVFIQVADESGACAAARCGRLRSGAGAEFGRTSRMSNRRRTTCTSSTPAAPPACRRACCGARPIFWSRRSAGAPPTDGSWKRSTTTLNARRSLSMKMFPAAPFMHGAGHWVALAALHQGNTVSFRAMSSGSIRTTSCR